MAMKIQNYFTRQFKQAYGLSPRAYRNYRN
ncbi:TPA: AraC family transcriptional regulator [Staphylococcus pseudintermedius]|nr:AraC family transcriptional regulator [Staphylococcus pseudintermedius]HAR6321054.1 AraC family transcriptional regulator [Staphylococcus pseudintermedius]